MDSLDTYQDIIETVLSQYTTIQYVNVNAQNEVLFDRQRNRYCVLSVGWDGVRRVHSCLIHVDILEGKVWVQRDDTEDGITYELEAAGIPKSFIVLGFKQPQLRQYTGYALA